MSLKLPLGSGLVLADLKRDRKKLRPPLRLMGFLSVKNNFFMIILINPTLQSYLVPEKKMIIFLKHAGASKADIDMNIQ